MASNPQLLSDLILVNQTTVVSQFAPRLLTNADGGFTVFWNDNRGFRQSDFHTNLSLRHFDANGSPISDEKLLHKTTDIMIRREVDRSSDGEYTYKYNTAGSEITLLLSANGGLISKLSRFDYIRENSTLFNGETFIEIFPKVEDHNSVNIAALNKAGEIKYTEEIFHANGDTDVHISFDIKTVAVDDVLYAYWHMYDDKYDDSGNVLSLDRYYMVYKLKIENDGSYLKLDEFRFSPKGVSNGLGFDPNPDVALLAAQSPPSLTPLESGGFLLVWNQMIEHRGKVIPAVLSQVYTADFRPVGKPQAISDVDFHVDNFPWTSEAEFYDSVALTDGGAAVLWGVTDAPAVDKLYSLYVRIIGPDGIPRGDVITLTHSNVHAYDLALVAGGNIVMTWDGFRIEDDLDSDALAVSAIVVDPGSSAVRTLGSNEADDLVGGEVGELFNGFDGNDNIHGNAGADGLYGAAGLDTLTGGQGNDILDGGDGTDVAVFTGRYEDYSLSINGEHVTVTDNRPGLRDGVDVLSSIEVLAFEDFRLALGHALTGPSTPTPADNLLLGTPNDDTLDGLGGSDAILGGLGFDTLIGGLGNDILDGGANPANQGDFLLGGEGDDTYHVDSPLDFVDEGTVFPQFGFGGFDTIISTADFFWDLYSVGENLVVSEAAVDPESDGTTIVHSVFSGELVGSSKTNIMFGRGGSDTYRAGDGVDFMSLSTLGVPDAPGYTANGVNTVIVERRESGPFSYDIVFEFEAGKDRLDVSDYGFANAAAAFATGVNVDFNGDGDFDDVDDSSYFILGDGLDYLYMVGTTLGELSAGDFIV